MALAHRARAQGPRGLRCGKSPWLHHSGPPRLSFHSGDRGQPRRCPRTLPRAPLPPTDPPVPHSDRRAAARSTVWPWVLPDRLASAPGRPPPRHDEHLVGTRCGSERCMGAGAAAACQGDSELETWCPSCPRRAFSATSPRAEADGLAEPPGVGQHLRPPEPEAPQGRRGGRDPAGLPRGGQGK